MAIFQKTVLKNYVSQCKDVACNVSAAYQKFCDYFHNPEIQANIREIKEESFQEGFLTNLFVNVLGYTLNPSPNYNLRREEKNVNDSKKADGAILVPDNKGACPLVKAVIELKDTRTSDLKTVETQAFGYKNNHREATYVIISNFEKLHFYIDNAVDFEEFNLFTLNEEDFARLYLCLAYENIKSGLPKKIKNESVSKEVDITKLLYKDYSSFKRDLFNSLIELNPELDKLLLFKKSA